VLDPRRQLRDSLAGQGAGGGEHDDGGDGGDGVGDRGVDYLDGDNDVDADGYTENERRSYDNGDDGEYYDNE
jgi:hypothetical protein